MSSLLEVASPHPKRDDESIVTRYVEFMTQLGAGPGEDGSHPAPGPPEDPPPLTKQDFEALARFRFGIRSYLRFSEETVRQHGVTPQQYQLMLAIKDFPGRAGRWFANWPTGCNCAITASSS
jgi:hypothetical protein